MALIGYIVRISASLILATGLPVLLLACAGVVAQWQDWISVAICSLFYMMAVFCLFVWIAHRHGLDDLNKTAVIFGLLLGSVPSCVAFLELVLLLKREDRGVAIGMGFVGLFLLGLPLLRLGLSKIHDHVRRVRIDPFLQPYVSAIVEEHRSRRRSP